MAATTGRSYGSSSSSSSSSSSRWYSQLAAASIVGRRRRHSSFVGDDLRNWREEFVRWRYNLKFWREWREECGDDVAIGIEEKIAGRGGKESKIQSTDKNTNKQQHQHAHHEDRSVSNLTTTPLRHSRNNISQSLLHSNKPFNSRGIY